jgi:transcriptional regulator with XRE-family HTH domain
MKRGLTQRELADSLYLSSQAVSKWENRQAAPDIFMLPKLANLLGCRIDDLFHNYD